MHPRESVTFSIYIPVRQMAGESSNFYLYYRGSESNRNGLLGSLVKEHEASGDLQGCLTVSVRPREGSQPSKNVWRLDEEIGDALWVREIFTELANRWRSDLKEFLALCVRDVMQNPAKPFLSKFASPTRLTERD